MGSDAALIMAETAFGFWRKVHIEGLCHHRDGRAWTECERLQDNLDDWLDWRDWTDARIAMEVATRRHEEADR